MGLLVNRYDELQKTICVSRLINMGRYPRKNKQASTIQNTDV
jgi:hypothetical protein